MEGLIPLLRTRKEAAKLLGISERTVDALLAKGELPKVRIGRGVRILQDDILAYIDAHKKGGR